MDSLRNALARINQWVAAHWQQVIIFLCFVVIMQQCAINRLTNDLDLFIKAQSSASAPAPSALPAASDSAAVDSAAVVAPATVEVDDEGSSLSWVPFVLLLVAALVLAALNLMRRGVYPFGHFPVAKLSQNEQGQVVCTVSVRNRSRKELSLANPTVCFRKSGDTRVFRAMVSQLPISLQPGTSFSATINITNLILREPDLRKSKAFSFALDCNGVNRSSIPQFVRFK